jgi:signal transduction histidine kinase
VFTKFLLANTPVEIGEDSPLQQVINLTDEIELSYSDNVISFEFAALDYSSPKQNRYRYMLEGFDEDWTEVDSNRRLVTYTNLDPGRYILHVAASSSEGVWNETSRELALIINPPWWETTVFRIAIVVLAVGLATGGYRWRVRNLEARGRKLEAEIAERTHELSVANEELNHEVTERKRIEELLFQRIEWLSTLNRIRQTINGTADLSQAYENLCDTILQLLNARTVFILNWNGHGEQINTLSHVQEEEISIDLNRIAASFQNESPLRKEIEQGDLITITADQADSLPSPLREWIKESDPGYVLVAPMNDQQSTVGALGLAISQPMQELPPAQADLVETIALDLANLAVEAHLLDQARALVAVEERNRLARDLHDSVTQGIYSASLIAETLQVIWEDDPKQGRRGLEQIERLTRGALAELRTLLLEMQPEALTDRELPFLIRQLADTMMARANTSISTTLLGDCEIPTEVKIALYRITQEALNNVVKHSQARHAKIKLESDCEKIILRISDDGIGFEPENPQFHGMGISNMNSRAKDIEASLTITSQPGKGTEVLVTRPGSTHE